MGARNRYLPTAVDASDPNELDACLRGLERALRDEPYYSSGRSWGDYAPAYRHALAAAREQGGRTFAQAEPGLADEWEAVRGDSRLTWAEARPAMEAAWRLARHVGGH